MRRPLALAVLAAALAGTVPAHAANYVKCVTDHSRIGFPYGGYYVDADEIVACVAPI